MAITLSDARADDEVMMELNTTPLIDVLLVLLVMLILTIPPQWHAVNLQLPSTHAAPVSNPKPQVVQIELAADGRVHWNGEWLLTAEDLNRHMQHIAQQMPLPQLHIRPHLKGRYADVAAVLASAQRHGLDQMALLDGVQ